MKDHHAHFNGNYPNEDFNQLWSAYIRRHMGQYFEMMQSLIRSAFPNVTFAFSDVRFLTNENENSDMEAFMVVTAKDFEFSVTENSVWTDIRRVLVKKMTRRDVEYVCHICCEASTKRVTCNKCSSHTCGECYIRAFVSGHGVIVCPFCRNRFGRVFPRHAIPAMVDEIRSKFYANS